MSGRERSPRGSPSIAAARLEDLDLGSDFRGLDIPAGAELDMRQPVLPHLFGRKDRVDRAFGVDVGLAIGPVLDLDAVDRADHDARLMLETPLVATNHRDQDVIEQGVRPIDAGRRSGAASRVRRWLASPPKLGAARLEVGHQRDDVTALCQSARTHAGGLVLYIRGMAS
jgi:hypothetical protein